MKKKILEGAAWLLLCILFVAGCVGLEWMEERRALKEQTPVEPKMEEENTERKSVRKLVENETVAGYEDRAFYRFTYEKESGERVGAMAEKLQECCSGIEQIYVMPVPGRVIAEEGFEEDQERYQSFLEQLKQELPDNSILLDVSPVLKEHKEEEVFYKTENIWTARGAYYGAGVFLEKTGRKSIPLEEYEEYIGNRFKGKVEDQKEIAEQKEKGAFLADNRLYYYWLKGLRQQAKIMVRNPQGKEESYKKPLFTPSSINQTSLLDDDYDRAIVEGESVDKKKEKNYLLVLNDRAGAWVVPYLKDYYDGIYVVNLQRDPYFYKDAAKIIKEYRITELLWVQNAMELGKKGYDKALEFEGLGE